MKLIYNFLNPNRKLPDRPSELIRLAIRDMKGLDREKYWPEHGMWHTPVDHDWATNWRAFGKRQPQGVECLVCLAGAVIAGSLNGNPGMNLAPSKCSDDQALKLLALDDFRQGDFWCGVQRLTGPVAKAHEEALADMPGPVYQDFRSWEEADRFLGELEQSAAALEELGY